MSDWLAPVRDALAARSTPVATFVRDDDGGWTDDRLFAMLDVFERHDVPIDVAVIPEALGRTLADQLLERVARSRVHLHQHGRSHTNHEPADRRKCEFGPARGIEALRTDVVVGRRRLQELLGDAAEPVFTPPWNRCVDGLGDVLATAGLRVLSRDRSAGSIGHPALIEVPITVDWFGSTRGVRWSRIELGHRIASELAGQHPVGIMLHHGVTGDDELDEIEGLVALLAAHDTAVPTALVEIAADRVAAGS